mmetsp:Transcript_8317/g.19402  ORF Transcript_8317/g.19402 Transcript_8317/m.19402 type:complete len:81 (-) Transcript_8317:488-730(-)
MQLPCMVERRTRVAMVPRLPPWRRRSVRRTAASAGPDRKPKATNAERQRETPREPAERAENVGEILNVGRAGRAARHNHL